jgi:hypothetical protein
MVYTLYIHNTFSWSLTVWEIIKNTWQINPQHCYTMLTCLNLAYSAINYSLQSMHEDCLLLDLISSLYKASFHLNLYVYIFFNYHGGLLHVVVCVEVLQRHPLLLALFWSWSTTFSFGAFTVKWQTRTYQRHYVCLSAYNKFRTAKWMSLKFYIRTFS